MKKILILTIISILFVSPLTYARTVYNSDNTINKSGTIRGQKRYKEQVRTEKVQAAAAAEIPVNDVTVKNSYVKNSKTAKLSAPRTIDTNAKYHHTLR